MSKVDRHSPGMISSDASQAGDASARDHEYLKTTKIYEALRDELGPEEADQVTGSTDEG